MLSVQGEMLTSSSIGHISQRCQERVAQRGHTHKGVYLGSHQPAASAQSAVSSQAVPGGRGCRKESLAHLHLYTNLVRAQLCPLACNPLHCLMEGTVSGSTKALPPAHSQARPGQGWGDGTGQGWLLVVGQKNASCLGTEKSVGVSWAFACGQRTAPGHSSSMHLLFDWRWAAPLVCACRPLEGADRILPLSP